MGTTGLHILVLSAIALNYFESAYLQEFNQNYLVFYKSSTFQLFILGVQDIFVSFMLWFMMDGRNQPLYVKDHKSGDVF
jgi:hypothetical protein